ncbi:MAG: DUF4266 domain-containing protein [Polyangiales bacterium]
MVSRSSSESRRRRGLGSILLVAALATTAGCATVRPEDREYLADPSMTYGGDGTSGDHLDHVLANREGGVGAATTGGGGCGCN